jgi:translocation and assembly module TamA
MPHQPQSPRLTKHQALTARGGALLVLLAACIAAVTAARADQVDVEIAGIEGEAAKNVRAALGIANVKKDPAPDEIARLHGRAKDEIALALEPFGYYRPVIDGMLAEVEPRQWQARYAIDPGSVVLVRSLDLRLAGEGETDPECTAPIAAFPLAPGDSLRHAPYEDLKAKLAQVAADNGYFDAAFDSTAILVDRDSLAADIVVHFTTGPRYRFGALDLRQDILDPRVLAGYVTFAEGDPYEVEKLLALQSGLTGSPYFSRVEVKPVPEEAAGLAVPIAVALEPRKTQRFDVGFGYGTDTGLRGAFDFELRRLNRRGHRAEGGLRLSQIEQSASVRYIMPSFHPSKAVYSLYAGYAHLEPETSESDKWVIGGNVTQPRWGFQETISLSYEIEDFVVGLDEGRARLFMPAVGYERTRADDRIFTRRGYRLRFDVRGAHEEVLSNVTLLSLRGDVNVIRPLGTRARCQVRAGAARVFTDDFHELPATLRFFAGGDKSVRGYRYRSLGPLDAEGNVIGGEAAVEGSGEIEYRIYKSWGVAAFYDAGNAFMPGEGLTLEQGVGAGLRWISPVGLISVDGAYAIGTANMVRLHIGIGPDL